MSRTKLVLLAGAAALLIAACSSSPTVTTSPTSTTPGATVPTTSAPESTTPATSGLSGTWAGQYSGAYQGSFTLTWHQSGSNLSGTIKLSAPPGTLPIHGTVEGGAISFGTVGSLAITYSGSVSGNSMSGTYQVNGSGGGPWSANKTS
jgi:hypothetical protein